MPLSVVSLRPGTTQVARVAAHAGLLLLEKYHSLTDECEIYCIAIGTCPSCLAYFMSTCSLFTLTAMSPDRKLDWFRNKGWSKAEIKEVRCLIVVRWDESYVSVSTPAATVSTTNADRPAVLSVCTSMTQLLTFPSANGFTGPVKVYRG